MIFLIHNLKIKEGRKSGLFLITKATTNVILHLHF